MASVWDVVNLIFGILGALGIFQLGYALLSWMLPAQRLRALDHRFQETNMHFQAMANGGLIPDSVVRKMFKDRLSETYNSIERIRAKVNRATTLKQQINAWRSGLSSNIDILYYQATVIRADITRSSEQERKRQEQAGIYVAPPLVYPFNRSWDSWVLRRPGMHPTLRRILAAGAPFTERTLDALLRAARLPTRTREEIRNAIQVVPDTRPFRIIDEAPAPVASGSNLGYPTQGLVSRSQAAASSSASSSSGTSINPIDGLYQTLTTLGDTVATLSERVEARRASGSLGQPSAAEGSGTPVAAAEAM